MYDKLYVTQMVSLYIMFPFLSELEESVYINKLLTFI